jgi:LAS superfamily LD-carboxypeptidase LdcB
MPQNNRRVSMRLRRLVTLSVVGVLAIGAVSVFGLPKIISDQVAELPESIQNIANQVQPKPVTIFDPPKYSIDEADSIWVVVNKQRQISPLKYQPAALSSPDFPKPKVQNPYVLQLRAEAAIAAVELATAMAEAGKGTLILNSGFRTYKNQQGLYREPNKKVANRKLQAHLRTAKICSITQYALSLFSLFFNKNPRVYEYATLSSI